MGIQSTFTQAMEVAAAMSVVGGAAYVLFVVVIRNPEFSPVVGLVVVLYELAFN